MKCAIAIFAKTIGLSPVKTRLAATIGEQKANAFYRLSVECVEATLQEASQLRPDSVFPVWAMAEENSPKLETPDGFPAVWTGDGGLGTRLASIDAKLRKDHDAVMMIGTDSPQLDVETLLGAIAKLRETNVDAVSGPAVDGGYYLFVSSKPVSRDVWEAVTYSAPTTLAEFEALLRNDGFSVGRIATMQDVDEFTDLASLQSHFEGRVSRLSREQTTLLDWLRANSTDSK